MVKLYHPKVLMATLSEAAKFSKKTARWLAVATAVVVGLLIVIALLGTVKNILFPPKPPPATVSFGKIPKLDLSDGIKAQRVTDYKIETVTGELPSLVTSVKVFKVAAGGLSFGDLERAKQVVSRVGFVGEGQNLDGNLYKFSDPKSPDRTITIDITNYNFDLASNYLQDPSVILSHPRSVDQSKEAAINFMDTLELDINQFPPDKVETRLLKIDGGRLTPASSASNANLVEVNFKRADINKLAILTPKESSPTAQALVSRDKVIFAYVFKLRPEFHQFATYPTKGVTRAFDEIRAQKGYFNKEPEEATFAIRDVSLAYMETRKSGEFLQPVYVFKGDKGLEAFVAAVDEAWTE